MNLVLVLAEVFVLVVRPSMLFKRILCSFLSTFQQPGSLLNHRQCLISFLEGVTLHTLCLLEVELGKLEVEGEEIGEVLLRAVLHLLKPRTDLLSTCQVFDVEHDESRQLQASFLNLLDSLHV